MAHIPHFAHLSSEDRDRLRREQPWINARSRGSLQFIGSGTLSDWEQAFQHRFGIGQGRIWLLQEILASVGCNVVRVLDDDSIRTLFERLAHDPWEVGLNGGSITGLRGPSIFPISEEFTPILVSKAGPGSGDDSQSSHGQIEQQTLSKNGLAAFKELASVFDDPREESAEYLSRRIAALPADLNLIEEWLNATNPARDGMGHNGPPDDMRLDLSAAELASAQSAISCLRQEVGRPDPVNEADPGVLADARNQLAILRRKVTSWGERILQGLLVHQVEHAGHKLWTHYPELVAALDRVGDTLVHWLHLF